MSGQRFLLRKGPASAYPSLSFPPAMHRLWHNLDVVALIVDHIRDSIDYSDDHGDPTGHRSLAALARVCKAVSPVALNSLWHELTDFRPVHELLRVIATEGTSELDGSARWDIFDAYASRVRAVRMNSFRDDVTSNVQAALKQRTPLLPCLQALSWVCRGTSLQYLPCFASSMLDTVWLSPTSTWILHDELRPPLVDLLRGLSDNSPNLRELSLIGFIMRTQTESVARDNLQQIASLRALSVLSIDLRFVICPEMVQVLADMPHLRSLYFSSLNEDPPPSRAFAVARAGFDKLACLTLAMSRGLTEMVLEALPPCGVTYVRMSTIPHGG
ncbi:hypothetical protein EVG20_g10071, partial [Dentipellis fragilis]